MQGYRTWVMLTSDMLTISAAVEYQLDSSRSICNVPLAMSQSHIYVQA